MWDDACRLIAYRQTELPATSQPAALIQNLANETRASMRNGCFSWASKQKMIRPVRCSTTDVEGEKMPAPSPQIVWLRLYLTVQSNSYSLCKTKPTPLMMRRVVIKLYDYSKFILIFGSKPEGRSGLQTIFQHFNLGESSRQTLHTPVLLPKSRYRPIATA